MNIDLIKKALDSFNMEKLRINNLKEDLETQAELYAYWATMLAVLDLAKAHKELELEQRQAEMYLAIRGRNGKERITEASIEAEIASNPDIRKLKREIAELEYYLKKARAIETAWRHRAQALWARVVLEKGEISMRAIKEVF